MEVAVEYEQALRALAARGPEQPGVGPSLERMRRLAELLDHPERTAPAIHLTGTNGKTTTVRMCAALLAALGIGAGAYTSPHLQDVRERIAVAGRPISTREFADAWAYLGAFFAGVGGLQGGPVPILEDVREVVFT